VTSAEGQTSAAPGDVLGPSSIAINNSDHVMVAWVERMGQGHVLKTRRFVVKACPP
jgi:hypothetical protein